MKKTFILIFTLAAAVALAACQTAGGQGGSAASSQETAASSQGTATPAPPAETSLVVEKTMEMSFFDSSTFDWDLSGAMGDHYREIEVEFPASFSLNDIPERVDNWFGKIKESGGSVKAQALPPKDQVAMRGIISAIIDIIVALFDAAQESALYGPAENYNALLLYQKDTGQVETLVFNHR